MERKGRAKREIEQQRGEKKEKKRGAQNQKRERWGGRSPVDVVFGVRHPVLRDDALGGQVCDGATEPVTADVIRPGEPIPPGQAKIGDLRGQGWEPSFKNKNPTMFSPSSQT